MYYAGTQWAVWGELGLRPPRSMDPNQRRYKENLILPKVTRAVAKLSQINGEFRVAPKSSDRKDRHAAKIGDLIFAHLRQTTKFQAKRRRALTWAAICGSGYLKVTWDPDKGDALRIYHRSRGDKQPTIAPYYDDELRRQKDEAGEFRDLYEGDISVEVVSPFQLHWDPIAKDEGLDGCKWVAQVSACLVEDVKNRYGVQVEASETDRGAEYYERQIAFLADGLGAGAATMAKSEIGKRVRVIEYFERPSKSNRMEGRYILVAGDHVIRSGRNPYAATGSPLPFVKVDWFPMPGRFTGLSLVDQLRGPQREHNEARAHAISFRAANGHAPTFLAKGAGVKPVQMAGIHGAIYEYNSAYPPPVFGSVPQLPPYIFELANQAQRAMNEISAQSDPANGKLPGQIRGAPGIQMMQADNNAILTPTSESMLEAVAEAGTQMLQLAGLFYDTPRVVQVIGKGGEFDVESFMGADLRGHYQLKIYGQPGSLETAESYQAKVMEMTQMGILNVADPNDRTLALKALNFGTESEIVNSKLRQESAAERALARMIEDPMFFPQAMPWHDPAVYTRVLEDYMNSQEFDQVDDLAKQKISQVWQAYSQIIQQKMQAQMAMMEASKGQPSMPGVASQPKMQK
jgi:hypothetical protein